MADLGIKLNNLVNAVNVLDKIYIETDIETPDNVLEQLSNIKSYTMELLSDLYKLEEAKRLLRLVLSDVNSDSCCANCFSCKHLGNCEHNDRYEWQHTDEVEKLLNS